MMYEWLKDYRNIEIDIMKIENDLVRSRRELKRWEGGDLWKVKLAEDSIASGLEERIEAMEIELAHKMNDLFDIKRMVMKFELVDHQILYGRYIEGKTFDEIADDLGYAKGTVYNKHAMLMKVVGYLEEFSAIE